MTNHKLILPRARRLASARRIGILGVLGVALSVLVIQSAAAMPRQPDQAVAPGGQRAPARVLAQPAGWPSTWELLTTDPDENGCDDHRNVINAYSSWTMGGAYIFLRLETVDPPGWPPNDDARYKWFISTGGSPVSLTGGTISGAEILLMVEDAALNGNNSVGEDKLGEMTVMDDLGNIGFTTRWGGGSPPAYFSDDPANGSPDPSTIWDREYGAATGVEGPNIGYRITGNYLDVYVKRSWIGVSPGNLNLMWATDNVDPNLDSAPNCDRSAAILDLAVELTRFEAQRIGRPVLLSWETASEFKHAGFRVVRAESDGREVVVNQGLIAPRGGELGGAAYRFTDLTAPATVLRYWLEDVDTRGQITRHGPVLVGAARSVPIMLPVPGRPGTN